MIFDSLGLQVTNGIDEHEQTGTLLYLRRTVLFSVVSVSGFFGMTAVQHRLLPDARPKGGNAELP